MGFFDFLLGNNDKCGTCYGTGTVDRGNQPKTCSSCGGSGKGSDGWSNEKDSEGNRKSQERVDQEMEDLKKYY
ncbi:hypothetical protein K9M48_02540 [Candidatus Gracilibacteria bacterium]|nr:hypothetical protein [Candidatus Gracilibacteria bacterium]